MTEPLFTRDYAWDGGTYDLAIVLGPRDDARLARALRALWTHPDLEGCYLHTDREPHAQQRVEVDAASLETALHGVARIGSRAPIACITNVIRYDHGIDWIHFGLPMGSLTHIFDVGAFPFADGNDLAWRPAVDEWLCAIGGRVFDAVAFRFALVGWDGGDLADADRFEASGVPEVRWVGYLVPTAGRLQWFAPNRGAPFEVNARR